MRIDAGPLPITYEFNFAEARELSIVCTDTRRGTFVDVTRYSHEARFLLDADKPLTLELSPGPVLVKFGPATQCEVGGVFSVREVHA